MNDFRRSSKFWLSPKNSGFILYVINLRIKFRYCYGVVWPFPKGFRVRFCEEKNFWQVCFFCGRLMIEANYSERF